MNTQSTLHVLAVTSGLSDRRIAELWEQAERHALEQTGEQESHHYWQLAHQKLTELVEHEALVDLPRVDSPWVMFDTHLGLAYVEAVDTLKEFAVHVRQLLRRDPEHPQSPQKATHSP
ncbi:hypothetical protein [Pseudomonas sp. N040]|uniref:hypothetical protein n=1 Tax=Pseudomonas sp. N040 TaxID=2785325 RepID=UPI0018A2EE5D|nr:hypothetical protein [Pseudomonas sp. N040]MBF7731463.1 hypothetical protein [Pseudomonas sp. N040]MBW7015107.1 hypothetical protein [Pseudomonas sp. N040]